MPRSNSADPEVGKTWQYGRRDEQDKHIHSLLCPSSARWTYHSSSNHTAVILFGLVVIHEMCGRMAGKSLHSANTVTRPAKGRRVLSTETVDTNWVGGPSRSCRCKLGGGSKPKAKLDNSCVLSGALSPSLSLSLPLSPSLSLSPSLFLSLPLSSSLFLSPFPQLRLPPQGYG